jgi:hypothetical protein
MDIERHRARLIALSVIVALISLPLVLGLVPPNSLYGFRTSLTLSSSAIWYAANGFLGWALLIAALVSGAVLWILPATVKRWQLWAAFSIPLAGAAAASFSYLGRFNAP